MNKSTIRLAMVSATFLVAVGSIKGNAAEPENIADQAGADTIIFGGKIYTMNADQPWAEAAAMKNGVFVEVGTDQELLALKGRNTELVNLAGKLVLPGLHDTHIHITGAKTVFADGYCKLSDSTTNVTAEGIYAEVEACRDRDQEATGWFVGGGWPGGAFPPDGAPDKAILDKLFPNRPVFLVNDSIHAAWVNSSALVVAGISKDTPDPINGRIKRDPITGEATGTLFETAFQLVSSHIPEETEAEQDAALYKAMKYANSIGITAMFDAGVTVGDLDAFDRLLDSDRMSVRLRGAIWANTEDGGVMSASEARAISEKYERPGVRLLAVKIMLDGVIEGATAAQLENYVGLDHAGEMFMSSEVLEKALIDFDAAGIQVKMHGYGSLAIREGLNAVEAALAVNGDNDLRHHIDHLAQVNRDDLPRFAATKTIAGSTLLWASPGLYEFELVLPMLGRERYEQEFPMRSLLNSDALIISGSDWPVTSMNPWGSIATGITRRDPAFPDRPALNVDETLDLHSLIASYTTNAAFVMHQENLTGSIETGKSADLIVLDRNLFEIDPEEIRGTTVEQTFFKGRVVYSKQ